MVAALRAGRSSIGIEIDADYCRIAARYLKAEATDLFSTARLSFEKAAAKGAGIVNEDRSLYNVRPARTRLS